MRYKARRLLSLLFRGDIRAHLSQYGEDVFLHKLFRRPAPGAFYVDVGANHPFNVSNTGYLWLLGWNGVNVDASQTVMRSFERIRPDDLNVHAAVVDAAHAAQHDTITFYFAHQTDKCATCDPEVARARNMTLSETVPCCTIESIIEQACARHDGPFDLLNIDIEGLDEQVVGRIQDWPRKPRVLMLEMYGETVRELLARPACRTLEAAGYAMVERRGHTAIFQREVDLPPAAHRDPLHP